MSQSNSQLATVINYMKSHWPSQVKPEWQVSLDEYHAILQQAVADLTLAATQNRHLLPAVEAYCDKNNYEPILMAARRFVEYHPHYQEIKDFYGEENLRKHTDEFATIMLFLTLSELIKGGYDIVLDVTLLAPEIEAILLELIKAGNYELLILMIAVSPTVTEHFLQGRAWRHTKATEQEFIRATSEALEFYATKSPDTHIILWSVYDRPPIYDGPIKGCLDVFADYSSRDGLPARDDDARRDAKISYLTADSN